LKKQSNAILDQNNNSELIDGLINNDDSAYETLVRQYSAKTKAILEQKDRNNLENNWRGTNMLIIKID
tara:strand:- start:633 stop:836 length:204 start_codon:yes stop_codon:yes gene_type:complete